MFSVKGGDTNKQLIKDNANRPPISSSTFTSDKKKIR